MISIEPKSSIDSPTAKKVMPKRIGFRTLERMVKPMVAGNLAVSFCKPLEETRTSC